MVNRIWQGHFGRGLVENANDFGTQTPPPTHPELLDWLAGEFLRQGWSNKAMHRLIMTSDAYRQSAETDDPSRARAELSDPENTRYWHYPRRRLSAECIRDSILAVAGELNPAMYGPGVRPELPPNYNQREKWEVSKIEADRNRRSIYIFAKRNLPFPMLQAFGLPDMHESCARRANTTTAPQALALLNDEQLIEGAGRFAKRLAADGLGDLRHVASRAFEDALAREATEEETAAAVRFIEKQTDVIAKTSDSGNIYTARYAALIDFCHALLNANEFLYVE
jgi:hypothetical protein